MVAVSVGIQTTALPESVKAGNILQLENTLREKAMTRFNVDAEAVSVRQAEPDVDLAFADTQQITGPLVADAETAFVNTQLSNNKVLGFYAIVNLSANPLVNRIRFRRTALAGAILASIYTEIAYADSPTKIWMEEFPIYEPSEQVVITAEAFATVAAPGERVVLEGLIAEINPLVARQ